MKNILVTGGSGFLGSHVCDKLSENKHEVTIFDTKNSSYLKNYKFYKIDINKNLEKLNLIVKSFKPNYIVNYIAQGMVAESWIKPHHWYKTNILSKVKMYDLLSKNRIFYKRNIKPFIS